MLTTATVDRSKAVRFGWAVAATVIAGWAIYRYWWLAVPRQGICRAIYPAPPGCSAHRLDVATLWTVIVAAVYVAVVAALVWRPPTWVRAVLSALLLVACGWGYFSTLYATPFGFR